MSVLVTDTRTVVSEADANTGGTWTGGGGSFTSPFVESTAAWVGTLNIATGQLYFDLTTPISAVNQMIYVWSNNFALQGSWSGSAPANAMYLGDGTNNIAFMLAGSDKKEFSHLTDQDWNWDCLLLDMDRAAEWNALGKTIIRNGTFAGFNSASVDRFGADMTTLSKGLGGGVNVAVDIIRMGNNGLRIISGSVSDPGKFAQIVAEDRATGSLKAHGIIREYTTGIYGIQGPLTFGTQSSAGSYFSDTNISLAFENRVVANNKYYLRVTGSTTADTTFILKDSSITTAGPYVLCDFSGSSNDVYIRKLEITGCTFSNLGNPIYFGNNLSSSFHTASNNTFTGCGQINAGNVLFTSNTIANTKNPSGSLIFNTASAALKMSDLSFIASGTLSHAIYITTAATYSLNNFNYSGYGADGTDTAVIYNASNGPVLINVILGDTPTYLNSGSSTTTVSSPATLTLTGMVSGTEVTIVSGSPPVELYHLESVDTDGIAQYSYAVGGKVVDILIFEVSKDPNLSNIYNYTLLSQNSTIPIQQIEDRIYRNG